LYGTRKKKDYPGEHITLTRFSLELNEAHSRTNDNAGRKEEFTKPT